tara:strand:+ start:73 stop:324 length:252 start_codon:yes stop_codon:yes gene_type:complete
MRKREPSYVPRPVRLELRISQVSPFVLRLEESQGLRLLDALRLLRLGTARIVGNQAPHDATVCDCLLALIEQEFGHLRREESK